MNINMRPIGFVQGGRPDPTDDGWDTVTARIDVDTRWLGEDVLLGLDGFSHAEVIFHFHRADPAAIETGARHPRNNRDWPLSGIFAQRVHARPNLIGVTICRITGVNGCSLHVRGLDAIDGTPVLDIKPFMTGFAPRGVVREPDWARELMSEYWHLAT